MNWIIASLLLVIMAWTLWPNGLAAMCWTLGHAIGSRLADRAFSNPTGTVDQPGESPAPDERA